MLNYLRKKIHTFLAFDNVAKKIIAYNRTEQLNQLALSCDRQGITNEKYAQENIIVSLTTYGKRLNQVYLTIESLMQQTLKPNKIVLWLDTKLSDSRLPFLLEKQTERGLEIRFCDDIRSYKKLIPSLHEYPDDVIITVDDDVFYNLNMLENLVSAYLKDNTYIYFNRGHRIRLLANNQARRYRDWEWDIKSLDTSSLNFPTGVGGILYPPNSLSKEVLNQDIFMNICPSADDIWFKAMALYNGTLCKKVETFVENGSEYIENNSVQFETLSQINNEQYQNDIQFKNVFERYNLYDKLK